MEIRPQKGPQAEFLASGADVAVYGGAAGGGKTFALLLEALRYTDLKDFKGVIFRKTLDEVRTSGGLWDEAWKLFPTLGAVPNLSELEWRFPSGATVRFENLPYEESKYRFQGAQFAFIGFDELTHFSESQFFYLLSRNRTTCGVRPYVRATTNPDKRSWVREFLSPWIDGEVRSGQMQWLERDAGAKIWHGRKKAGSLSVAFIRARLRDNRILMKQNPEYEKMLRSLNLVDRKRLLDGDWDAVEDGGMFHRDWFRLTPFVPANLTWVRFWDLAGSEVRPGRDPDWTVGALLGADGRGNYWVADLQRVRRSPAQVESLVRSVAESDVRSFGHVMVRMEQEPGSSGVAVVERYLTSVLAGFDFRGVRQTGSKVERARSLSALAEHGRVQLVEGHWNGTFLDEACLFPTSGAHDDQVDAVSGALNCLTLGREFSAYGGGEERGGFEPR